MIESGRAEIPQVMALAMAEIEARMTPQAEPVVLPSPPDINPVVAELASALTEIAIDIATKDYAAATERVAHAEFTERLYRAIEQLPDTDLVQDGDLTSLAANFAALEGWGVFWDQDRLMIQADDRMPWFASDEDAIRHVQNAAGAGSRLHELALSIHNRRGGT